MYTEFYLSSYGYVSYCWYVILLCIFKKIITQMNNFSTALLTNQIKAMIKTVINLQEKLPSPKTFQNSEWDIYFYIFTMNTI